MAKHPLDLLAFDLLEETCWDVSAQITVSFPWHQELESIPREMGGAGMFQRASGLEKSCHLLGKLL